MPSLSTGWSYQYDANGNMIQRNVSGNTYSLIYDAENRLTQVSNAVTATFGYDGDGKRVVAAEGVTTTVYIGNYYELSSASGITSTVKYYYAGATRVAMRKGSDSPK